MPIRSATFRGLSAESLDAANKSRHVEEGVSPYVRIVAAVRRRGGGRHCGAEIILLPQSVVHLPKSFDNILSNRKHLINLLAQMRLISPPSMAMVYGAIAKRQLSPNQQRHWRTRKDPFELVWSNEIEPMLNGRA